MAGGVKKFIVGAFDDEAVLFPAVNTWMLIRKTRLPMMFSGQPRGRRCVTVPDTYELFTDVLRHHLCACFAPVASLLPLPP